MKNNRKKTDRVGLSRVCCTFSSTDIHQGMTGNLGVASSSLLDPWFELKPKFDVCIGLRVEGLSLRFENL
jgi:hypothetical protein